MCMHPDACVVGHGGFVGLGRYGRSESCNLKGRMAGWP